MEQEILIARLVDRWKHVVGLGNWMLCVKIRKGYYPGDKTCEASVTEDLKYAYADIEIWKPFWKGDVKTQEITVLHELVHLVLCRLHPHLAPSGDAALEEVVQAVTMILFNHGRI